MVLDRQRDNIDPVLSAIAKLFLKVDPNLLSWFSVLFAFVAGMFFYFSSPSTELSNYYLYKPLELPRNLFLHAIAYTSYV